MLITFEGPDGTGIRASASNIGHLNGAKAPMMTRESYWRVSQLLKVERGITHSFCRIDWLSEMATRFVMPDNTWPSTGAVPFAAPNAHLVFKVYGGKHIDPQAISMNNMYKSLATMFMHLNETQHFALFKTITVMEVFKNTADGSQAQRVRDFSSPLYPWSSAHTKLVKDDQGLLEMLLHEETNR